MKIFKKLDDKIDATSDEKKLMEDLKSAYDIHEASKGTTEFKKIKHLVMQHVLIEKAKRVRSRKK